MKGFGGKVDKLLAHGEKAGFKTANFLHKATVNAILVGIGYCLYSTVRDYNENFKEERLRSMRELEIEGRINPKEDY